VTLGVWNVRELHLGLILADVSTCEEGEDFKSLSDKPSGDQGILLVLGV